MTLVGGAQPSVAATPKRAPAPTTLCLNNPAAAELRGKALPHDAIPYGYVELSAREHRMLCRHTSQLSFHEVVRVRV